MYSLPEKNCEQGHLDLFFPRVNLLIFLHALLPAVFLYVIIIEHIAPVRHKVEIE